MRVIFRLLGFLKPYIGEVLLSILLGVATIAAGIGLLGTSAYLIASAALHPSIAELQVAIVGVRFFGISRAAFRYGERLVSHSVNLRLVSALRSWFFEQMEKADQRSIKNYRTGDLLDRVLHNLEILEDFYVRVISPYIVFAVITVGICLFVGYYNPMLGWILAGGLTTNGILLPVLAILISSKLARITTKQYSNFSSTVVDSLDGMEELTAFGSNEIVLKSNMDFSKDISLTKKSIFGLGAFNNALAVFVSGITILAILWHSTPLVVEGFLTGILLAVFVQIAMASFEAANTLPLAAQLMTQSIAAGNSIFEISHATKQTQSREVIDKTESYEMIQVKQVSYTPGQEGFSLRDISFELNKGKRIALVGASGAGKSSLVELILKFITPDEGAIYFGKDDISSLSDEFVRNLFGVMGNEDYLFNNTLRDNLLLGKPGATDQELMECLKKVGLGNWISELPQGLNTWLGNHGASISGGEHQRIMLARLILQNRPYLILDEPLVHLDLPFKKDLFNILFTEMPFCGILWISHEYLYMEEMDEILFIENGAIIERGTHTALMTLNGKYATAFSLQEF